MPAQSIELNPLPNMERVKRFFQPQHEQQPYEPIDTDTHDDDDTTSTVEGSDDGLSPEQPFSWIEYAIFLLLGVAMLWAWSVLTFGLLATSLTLQ
jgi:solute carrier family 29 (equilibrative nucleoside transporter), member 1/2/3